jgi:hypothetical protein
VRYERELQRKIDDRDDLPPEIDDAFDVRGILGTAVISCMPMISLMARTWMPNSSEPSEKIRCLSMPNPCGAEEAG